MATKAPDKSDEFISDTLKIYAIVFGIYFLIVTLILSFSIGCSYFYYSTNGLIIFAISYAILGLLFGSLCGVSIILRGSTLCGICNIILSMFTSVVVFIFWV